MGKQVKHLDIRLPDEARKYRLRILRLLAGQTTTLANTGYMTRALAVTTDGNAAYLAMFGSPGVKKLDLTSGTLTDVTTEEINSAGCCLESGEQNLLICSDNHQVVKRVNLITGTVEIATGTLDTTGEGNNLLNNPRSICRIGDSRYIIGQEDGKIRLWDSAAGTLATVADETSSPFGFVGAASLHDGIAYLSNGNGIYKLVGSSLTKLAGDGAYGDIDGIGSAARLNLVYGITLDDTGTLLYMADWEARKVKVLDLRTNTVKTLVGTGTDAETDGTGTQVALRRPRGLGFVLNATAGASLIVSDAQTFSVRRIA